MEKYQITELRNTRQDYFQKVDCEVQTSQFQEWRQGKSNKIMGLFKCENSTLIGINKSTSIVIQQVTKMKNYFQLLANNHEFLKDQCRTFLLRKYINHQSMGYFDKNAEVRMDRIVQQEENQKGIEQKSCKIQISGKQTNQGININIFLFYKL